MFVDLYSQSAVCQHLQKAPECSKIFGKYEVKSTFDILFFFSDLFSFSNGSSLLCKTFLLNGFLLDFLGKVNQLASLHSMENTHGLGLGASI